jgi:hypothetical protein
MVKYSFLLNRHRSAGKKYDNPIYSVSYLFAITLRSPASAKKDLTIKITPDQQC